MTKMIKLSLVAAVAVAGFTTAASAANLADTKFSGKAEFEYDYSKDNASNATNGYDIDVDVKATTKLSDQWTAIVGAQADTEEGIEDNTALENGNVNLSTTYFQYADGTNTLKIGRQAIGTPFYDDQRGDGFVGLTTVGGVTMALAHFDNTNGAYSEEAVNAAAAIASIGPVNASLWYADISNTFSAYSLDLNGKFGIVNVDLRHTELDLDAATTDNSLTKLVVSAPVGPVTLTAGYGMTDKQGGTVALDQDTKANFELEQASLNGTFDSDVFLVAVGGTFGKVTASISHLTGEVNTDVDVEETLVKASYPLAKSLKATAFYSVYELDNVDNDKASIALEYKF